MVSEICTKQVPYTVCEYVAQECVKHVPVTVCRNVQETCYKTVPYTVCTMQPLFVDAKECRCHGQHDIASTRTRVSARTPYTVTEYVPQQCTKQVPCDAVFARCV